MTQYPKENSPKKLSLNKEELETLYETFPLPFALLDNEFGLLEANQGFRNLNQEIRETSLFDFMKNLKQDLARDKEIDGTNTISTGTEIKRGQIEGNSGLNYRLTSINLSDDSKARFLLSINITEPIHEPHDTSRRDSEILSVACHDIRQPIQALRMFAYTLETGSVTPTENRTLIKNISRTVEVTSELLDSFRELSDLNTGQVKVKKRVFKIETLLDSIRPEFDSLARLRNLNFRARGKSYEIESDPILLGRMLRNLLTNAMNYTSRGGVLLGCRRRNGFVEIQVLDTGPGLDAAHRIMIQKMFKESADYLSHEREGLGLGLHIVSLLAKRLGHDFFFNSIPGRGSCFSILLR